jgi:hypothetical protein
MPVTSIQNVVNNLDGNISFINLEQSGNNRTIPPGFIINVGNCWIPWCRYSQDFVAHHIQILDDNTDEVLWYVWQQNNLIRASKTGFGEPASLRGAPTSGASYNLNVRAGGITDGVTDGLFANQA